MRMDCWRRWQTDDWLGWWRHYTDEARHTGDDEQEVGEDEEIEEDDVVDCIIVEIFSDDDADV